MIGLAFGKFAPFHQGHAFFLAKTLTYVDELIILIYDHPELPVPDPYVRSRWIHHIMPSNCITTIEAYNAPPGGNTISIMNEHNKYKASLLPGDIQIDFVFCNEWYGKSTADYFNAKHIEIDPARTLVSISATQIRENPQLYADYLHPVVRKDLGV